MTALDAKYEYEYLVKYKNLSYLHIQWLSGAEIGKKVSNIFCPGSVVTTAAMVGAAYPRARVSTHVVLCCSRRPPTWYSPPPIVMTQLCRGDESKEQGGAEPLPHPRGQGRAPGGGDRAQVHATCCAFVAFEVCRGEAFASLLNLCC
jgi:hypothetical protein